MSEMEPVRAGRFGAATPGARLSPPSLEALLTSPEPPRRGRWFTRARILVAAGVVVALGAGFAAGHFTAGGPAPVRLTELMVTNTALPAGARLTRAEMRAVPVEAGARRPAGAMTPAAVAAIAGQVLRQPVPAGTFVEPALVTAAGALPNATHALVGLALKPGQLPAGGLTAGQQVLVVLLHVSSGGTSVRPQTLVLTSVWDVTEPDSSGNTLATVVVPAREASVLSAFAAQNEVALVATAIPKGRARTVIPPSPSPTPTPPPPPPPVAHKPKSTPRPSKKPVPHSSSPAPTTSAKA